MVTYSRETNLIWVTNMFPVVRVRVEYPYVQRKINHLISNYVRLKRTAMLFDPFMSCHLIQSPLLSLVETGGVNTYQE